jgi:hypothetical protein
VAHSRQPDRLSRARPSRTPRVGAVPPPAGASASGPLE